MQNKCTAAAKMPMHNATGQAQSPFLSRDFVAKAQRRLDYYARGRPSSLVDIQPITNRITITEIVSA
jgi:hypothetical protein